MPVLDFTASSVTYNFIASSGGGSMKDSFNGTKIISLQPADVAVPYTFTFGICTSATANDGAIPFGDTIASVIVKAYNEAGTDVTAAMISAQSEASEVVTVTLKYPANAGRYSLEFVVTLTGGAVMEFDFTRVYALDIIA